MKRRMRKLQLGGRPIKMVFRKSLTEEGRPKDEVLEGLWINEDSTIFISEDQPPAVIMETIIHECIHAVSDQYNLNLNEKKVTLLGKGLHSILAPFLKKV